MNLFSPCQVYYENVNKNQALEQRKAILVKHLILKKTRVGLFRYINQNFFAY